MWGPFCPKSLGDYWGRACTSFTVDTEASEGERWFWMLKCLQILCWMPLGKNVGFYHQLALFLSVFHPDGLRHHEASHRNSHFTPEGMQGHKNHAQSLFWQSYGFTCYWINLAKQLHLGASGFDGCQASFLKFVSEQYCWFCFQLATC